MLAGAIFSKGVPDFVLELMESLRQRVGFRCPTMSSGFFQEGNQVEPFGLWGFARSPSVR